jgi:hypothetical protein
MGLGWQIKKTRLDAAISSPAMQLQSVFFLSQWYHQRHHTSPYKEAEGHYELQVRNEGEDGQVYKQAGESRIESSTIL